MTKDEDLIKWWSCIFVTCRGG